jgi:hypothetical protein
MVLSFHICGDETKHDTRIPAGEPINNGRHKGCRQKWVASYSHFTDRRVGEGRDVLHCLAQIVEHYRSAIEQSAPVFSRRDPLPAAVEQTHAESVFEIRNRAGNGGLPGVQKRSGLAHATSLCDGHENVKVVQFHPTSDAVAQLHGAIHPSQSCYINIQK